ncbi:cytochrome c3 family protein [Geopsychrobacter electrodiphilus]|uniref:cytochrome c3 family protein n=1 Tax=Geopsychrobacter electrodiphilus TaxID=225196 RepID=UPI0003734801|nr:cytochrome c3 family protein [Geopsychrobacter electrodiphilus]
MFVASGWQVMGVFLLAMSLPFAENSFGMDAPDTIVIDILSKYYEPVEFNHQLHVDIAEDCSVCHHHTTGTGTVNPYCAKCHAQKQEMATVACVDCHAAETFSSEAIHRQSQMDLFHIDVNGLKGAYHQNCRGCHQEKDGPTGCQTCHIRTLAGDEFYHSGTFAPPPQPQGE